MFAMIGFQSVRFTAMAAGVHGTKLPDVAEAEAFMLLCDQLVARLAVADTTRQRLLQTLRLDALNPNAEVAS